MTFDGGTNILREKLSNLWLQACMVPTGTGNQGKPGKMGRYFPVKEKSGNFVKTGKVGEFYLKYWGNREKFYWKIEKNFKKYWKTVKNTGKVGEICQSEKVGTMVCKYANI